ncbi:MAG: RNA polymerase sigma-70 factor [Tannerellaceae bacterium]|jgi:RNA polymerase sigma-70 factor (ECF subfamily)|nr:RNA polymerase sigma-70 factor [Tannerellaceae bacterium]
MDMENPDTPFDTADMLLRKISENDDSDAFRLLFEHFYAPLCLYAGRYISDRPEREDIVQDVFSAIWEKRRYILPNTSAGKYLASCVKNSSLNYLRRQSYLQEYRSCADNAAPLYDEGREEPYLLQELEELLDRTLRKLPEAYRLAFVMSRFEEKSSAEIAQVMHVSVRTVERYRAHATEILRDELKDYLPLLLVLIYFP